MKLGLLTPVLSLVTEQYAAWEQDGTIDDVRQIAQAADRLGYDYLTCSEHIAIPVDGPDLPGQRYWDPLATLSYLAALTTRIRLTTSVVVLPYHHPLALAKRYGTLDRLSNGRLNLGVGVGYLKPEFDLLEVPYADRGERADDALRALRAAFGRPKPSYDGPYYSFGGMVVDPCGIQQDLPIWVGGRTSRSLRRAVALGDGWMPFAVSPNRAAKWLAEAAGTQEWEERDRPLEVILGPRRKLDPIAEPEQTTAALHELRDAGVTTVSLRFVHEALSHYLEQLQAMREIATAL